VRRALAAGTLAAFCFGGLASASENRPALKLVSTQPVIVRGLHFQTLERVRVSLLGSESESRQVRATAAGAFRVAFAGTAEDPCSAFAVRAVGARGSKAVLKINPECAPP